MRKILPLVTQTRPNANATITIWEDGDGSNVPTLLQQGMRELTLGMFNNQALTVTLYNRRTPNEAYQAVSSTALAASSSSNANQEHWDLTGYQGQFRVQLTGDSVACTTYMPSLECNDEVQAGGCAS